MSVNYALVIKRIQNLDLAYAIFSACTRLPFVECTSEECDDQAYLFSDEARARKCTKEYAAQNIPVGIVKLEKARIPMFLTSLHLMGVNMLVFCDDGGESRVPLDQIVTLESNLKEEKGIPLINASLQLTMVYFLQEFRRPNQSQEDMERSRHLHELEEEMMANLVRSRFIMALEVARLTGPVNLEKVGPKVQIPFVKMQNGDLFQPIFSDAWEFQKFSANPKKRFHMATVEFKGLLSVLNQQAKGFILNPNGIGLALTREHLRMIGKRFGI